MTGLDVRQVSGGMSTVAVIVAIAAVLMGSAVAPGGASPAGSAWTKLLPQGLLDLATVYRGTAGVPMIRALSSGTTITVGPGGPPAYDYETIQGAIDAASNGDTIVVAAATYYENLVWEDKDLRLISEVPGEARIDAGCWGSCLRIYNVPETSRLEGFTLVGGTATGAHPDNAGGGIYLEWSSPTITGNNIVFNEATAGGGIYCFGGAPTILDNTINGNEASVGGGIYFFESDAVITGNEIRSNTSVTNGGGILCQYGTATISGNTVRGNVAYSGGGVFLYETDAAITGNIIHENSAQPGDGGGVYVWACSPTIVNNTIAGNGAAGVGGGMFIAHPAAAPAITSTIVAFSNAGGGIHVQGGTAFVTYSNVFGNAGGDYLGILDPTGTEGNISLDPLFANPALGDLHLRSVAGRWDPEAEEWVTDPVHSPCIDAGDPASDYGNEPFPHGGTINMGAYGNTPEASKSATLAEVWVDDDYTAATPGWGITHFASIQDGIDAVAQGGRVYVAAGTYVENLAWDTRSLQLLGAGAGRSIVDGNGAASCLRMTDVPATSRVEGFTFTNGRATGTAPEDRNGGGIYLQSSSPTIISNAIESNTADRAGGGIYCNESHPAIIGNVISGNTSVSQWGGGIHVGNSWPTIVNNTLALNSADQGAGIYITGSASAPVITNTIVAFSLTGCGIRRHYGSPTISYCNVSGNMGGEYSGMIEDPTGSDGNISEDPLFAHTGEGDFHLRSVEGRWDGAQWVQDTVHSPCIDAGDPAMPVGDEPDPHGGRINMGAFGGTQFASMSAPAPTVIAIAPDSGENDGQVDVTITGTGFLTNAMAKLTRSGQPDIDGTGVVVSSATEIACSFDLTGAEVGPWNVVVTNSDGQAGQLEDGFTVLLPHEVTITAAPAGDPNPVASEGEVLCSVTAEDSHGHDLNYAWSAEGDAGSFDDETSASPTWTAPDVLGDYEITVTVTCDEDATISATASYMQTVGVHEVTIVDGPSGAPNPVSLGGAVLCSVDADCAEGCDLLHAWSAEGNAGSFNDATLAAPAWTAPAASGSYEITVTVTCAQHADATITASYTQQVVAHIMHTFRTGIQMVSLPLVPANPDPAQLGFDAGRWARWNPDDQGYVYYDADPTGFTRFDEAESVPGRGYWARFSHDTPVTIDGAAASGEAIAVECPPGWSQIGNPRFYDLLWSILGDGALRVHHNGAEMTLVEARAAGVCEDFAWAYRHGSGYELVYDHSVLAVGDRDRIAAWEGHWFLAYEPVELIFPSVTEIASATPRPAARPAEGDWVIPLVAALDDGSRAKVLLGQLAQPRQMKLPPSFGAGVQLSVLRDDRRLGVDLQEQGDSPVWTLQAVSGVADARVILQWPDLSEVPHDYRPMLVDIATGRRTYMRTSQGYSFTAGEAGEVRRFEVQMAPAGVGALVTTAAASATAGGNVELRVTLSAAATVDAEVINIAGRQVGTVCCGREMEAGSETLLWDVMSDRGTRLPGGMYLIRVTARTEDGQQTSALTPLQLGR